eukprot:scaffold60459_cov31-Tisochrysis_lutea.AAC.11
MGGRGSHSSRRVAHLSPSLCKMIRRWGRSPSATILRRAPVHLSPQSTQATPESRSSLSANCVPSVNHKGTETSPYAWQACSTRTHSGQLSHNKPIASPRPTPNRRRAEPMDKTRWYTWS